MAAKNAAPDAERDLSFHPADPSRARTLTRAQVEHFNERGYVMPLDVFDPVEADAQRAYFDMIMEDTARRGGNSYSINGYHARCRGLYDLCITPRILDYVQDILGPNFLVWGTHYFCKTPHDPKAVPWHQDASYWPLTPSRTVTVWLAIDDVDVENSAMRFIAGTHRMGHLAFKQTEQQAVLGQEVLDAETLGDIVDVELKAGQISLHSDMLVHGSLPNESDRRRCGLTIRYVSTDVRPINEGWGKRAILCRGRNDHPWWQVIDRPEGEDLELPDWEKKKD